MQKSPEGAIGWERKFQSPLRGSSLIYHSTGSSRSQLLPGRPLSGAAKHAIPVLRCVGSL